MRCFYVLQKAAKAGEGGDTVMTQTFMKEKKILPLVLSHVTADGHFHGGEFALQHCGQLFRGEAERGSHDGAGTGVSGAESHHIYCRRIRHRDQCLRGVLSGCGR